MERALSVYAQAGAALARSAPPLTPEQIEAGARILATVESAPANAPSEHRAA